MFDAPGHAPFDAGADGEAGAAGEVEVVGAGLLVADGDEVGEGRFRRPVPDDAEAVGVDDGAAVAGSPDAVDDGEVLVVGLGLDDESIAPAPCGAPAPVRTAVGDHDECGPDECRGPHSQAK